ncbi:UTP--glucose-1-phosphate uridylyltransferase [Marispirochaeta sp.]|uniref:UTP--glucose-1-phosphate uridylyltransferase n=1 Tax=Marispirochaeta sp. TaxID=2038653 RepID=UPI0029C95DA5|nr:UTP--glucose-1-phosphate uridylyltransferase [Marispirochaeta sp.]
MKGVIVAAGYGTRFLPVTKTVPKEMLPLIDRPAIDFIMDEFAAAGINEVLVISSRRKKALEDYFDREVELESVFQKEGAKAKLARIRPPEMKIFFTRQQEMRGTGDALLCARPFCGSEPFVVAYPDDLHFGEVPLARQLVSLYEKTGCSIMSALHDPPNLERYGVLALADDRLHVTDIVEKPAPGTEPSKEASIGRYLFTPEIFKHLEAGWKQHLAGPNPESEYFHIYALKQLMTGGKVVYHPIEGERLDTGAPAGYLRALLRYASKDPELAAEIKAAAARLK